MTTESFDATVAAREAELTKFLRDHAQHKPDRLLHVIRYCNLPSAIKADVLYQIESIPSLWRMMLRLGERIDALERTESIPEGGRTQ
jgi:hypothetical protein